MTTRKLIVVAAIMLAVGAICPPAQAATDDRATVNWVLNYEEAVKKATATKAQLVLDFYTDW